MAELSRKYGERLVVMAFPCNQFGHQENLTEVEILPSLKHVRPGGGFEPNFPMFGKVEVNGERAHPVFEFLKRHLPAPYDDPDSLMGDPKLIVWSPVRRSDVSWNFEKFLIAPDGKPFRRYSRRFPTLDIAADIEELMRALRL